MTDWSLYSILLVVLQEETIQTGRVSDLAPLKIRGPLKHAPWNGAASHRSVDIYDAEALPLFSNWFSPWKRRSYVQMQLMSKCIPILCQVGFVKLADLSYSRNLNKDGIGRGKQKKKKGCFRLQQFCLGLRAKPASSVLFWMCCVFVNKACGEPYSESTHVDCKEWWAQMHTWKQKIEICIRSPALTFCISAMVWENKIKFKWDYAHQLSLLMNMKNVT